ncbi:hypothetical protein KKR91_12935 [Arthrobacter jiangjiafuii]|uniref:Histone acetyltransferase Rv0428c-like SH3 domain-containing protein n=1 Tax=Arthrobacter jiangjiafuii TaxID=2817475 RepID=A0A975M3N2_9MICC|nr:hypothetical protein [Arthrobacter jiangjiafuii]MBP3044508.1 hypothetical protein [Arthrobacter jiangjiafuii]QWC09383.1 hypothetical protein KKR91_12935 [Arthrobacter jiangjiafuii]
MNARSPSAVLRALPPGTRVVLRYRIDGGFTDVLGPLVRAGEDDVTVAGRRGEVTVPWSLVTAGKEIPPPPPRRAPRRTAT